MTETISRPSSAPTGPATAYDLVIRGNRIMTTAGEVAREVGIRDGKIVAIEPLGNNLEGAEVIELSAEEVLLPGLVDTHVHGGGGGAFSDATGAATAITVLGGLILIAGALTLITSQIANQLIEAKPNRTSPAGARAGVRRPFVPFVQGNHTPGSASEKGCLTSG